MTPVLAFNKRRCRYCGAPDRVEGSLHSVTRALLVCLDCVRALLKRRNG